MKYLPRNSQRAARKPLYSRVITRSTISTTDSSRTVSRNFVTLCCALFSFLLLFSSFLFFLDNKRPTALPVRVGNRGFSRSWSTVNWTGWFAIRLAPLEKRKDNRYSGGNTSRRGDGTKGALDLIAFRKRGMASTRWRINNRGTRGVEHYFAPSLFNFIYL